MATVQDTGGCTPKFFTGQNTQSFGGTSPQDSITWDLTPSNGQGTPIKEGACDAFTDESCTCTVTFAVDPSGPYAAVAPVTISVKGFKYIPYACSETSPAVGQNPFMCYPVKSSWPTGLTQDACQTQQECAGCICGDQSQPAGLNTCPVSGPP